MKVASPKRDRGPIIEQKHVEACERRECAIRLLADCAALGGAHTGVQDGFERTPARNGVPAHAHSGWREEAAQMLGR